MFNPFNYLARSISLPWVMRYLKLSAFGGQSPLSATRCIFSFQNLVILKLKLNPTQPSGRPSSSPASRPQHAKSFFIIKLHLLFPPRVIYPPLEFVHCLRTDYFFRQSIPDWHHTIGETILSNICSASVLVKRHWIPASSSCSFCFSPQIGTQASLVFTTQYLVNHYHIATKSAVSQRW